VGDSGSGGVGGCGFIIMNCSNCGAPMRLDGNRGYLVCDSCRSIWFPEANADNVRVLTPSEGHDCPVCANVLAHATLHDHPLEYCRQCRGILIATGTFVGLVEALRWTGVRTVSRTDPAGNEELARRTSCPLCQREMDTHFYGGGGSVVIDNCPGCGMNWLDHDELQRIARAAGSVDDLERNLES
jgi:Zn-finger nucleic acid-binding protein